MKDPKENTPSEDLVDRIRELIRVVDQLIKLERRRVLVGSPHGPLELSEEDIMTLRAVNDLRGIAPLKSVVEHLVKVRDEPVYASAISAATTRLEKEGLLEKLPNENDKRQPLNSLTTKGADLALRIGEVEGLVLKNIVAALELDDALTADIRKRVERTYDRIKQRLEAKPTVAGVYDYILGGMFYTASDREWVEEKARVDGGLREAAKANRAFLQRAAYWLAKDCAITQFLDIGSGFPTNRNTHEVVLDVHPQAQVTYVDSDPDVIRRSRGLLHETANVCVAEQDLRFIGTWLNTERFQNLDLSRPVGILMIAVLHFIVDDSEVRTILRFLKDKLAPGSYLVISHSTDDSGSKQALQALVEQYSRQVKGATLRSRETIVDMLREFRVVAPGVVSVDKWRPELPDAFGGQRVDLPSSPILACVAKVSRDPRESSVI